MSAFFFFNDTATTEIYTLSLHDALPISFQLRPLKPEDSPSLEQTILRRGSTRRFAQRSEEHTSELQSRPHLVCRLLLEKKKTRNEGPHMWSLISIATPVHLGFPKPNEST